MLRIYVFVVALFIHGVLAAEERAAVVLENERIRAVFTPADSGVTQQFFARSGDAWKLVVESYVPPAEYPAGASQLYNRRLDPQRRHLASVSLAEVDAVQRDGNLQSVLLRGDSSGVPITQEIVLADGGDHFHVTVEADLDPDKRELDYLLSPFTFAKLLNEPEFTHAPCHKRRDDNIIGDGVFYAPAVIIQDGGLFAALAPDVAAINENVVYARGAREIAGPPAFAVKVDPDQISMPTGLDLDLQSYAEITNRPLFTYGVMDHIVTQHVYWLRDNRPGAMVRKVSSPKIRYAFDLFVAADAPRFRGYQRVAQHHWQKTGHEYFLRPRPQAMPLAEYARVCYPAYMKYQGYQAVGITHITHRDDPSHPEWNSWQQWQENGVPMGGWRLTAPQWYDIVYNCTWWNNVCDATGMYYWGQATGNDDWVDKARRAVNLTLSAPQKQGMFPSLYHLIEKRWIGSFWGPSDEGFSPNRTNRIWEFFDGDYMTSASSTTAAWLLEYYQTCEANEKILPYVENYAEFLISQIQSNGVVPEWLDKETLEPKPNLRDFNANGGLHAWVLAELYGLTTKPVYLEAARQQADFVIREVLPGQRWSDFETFYSCAAKPENFLDQRTGQPGRNLMSITWAINGLTSMYEVTGDNRYLDAAEAAADFGSLFQAVWAPHFDKVAYPFGGFAAQLGDGEWLDQRDHRFAGPLVKLGLLTGRAELIERGVAASRASLVLANHPRHQANEIYIHPIYPVGLGGENSIHGGYPQTALASGPSWNSVGGLAAAAHVARQLGGAYVDVKRNIAVGVDGVRVAEAVLDGDSLHIGLDNAVATLKHPYEQAFEIDLKVVGLAEDQTYRLSINGGTPQSVKGAELHSYRTRVEP